MPNRVRAAATFRDLADILLVTDAPLPVSVTQSAWADLKAARGQWVDFRRLGPAHHLRDTAPEGRWRPVSDLIAALMPPAGPFDGDAA